MFICDHYDLVWQKSKIGGASKKNHFQNKHPQSLKKKPCIEPPYKYSFGSLLKQIEIKSASYLSPLPNQY